MITDTTTARRTLAAHQQHVATLGAQAEALQRRIGEFQTTAAAARPPLQRLEALRAQRRELLAAVAVGESSGAALDKADAELETAEVQARSSLRGIEIAQAGSERLGREHEAVAGQLAIEQRKGDALRYAAGVELARSQLEPYRVSLAAMGNTYAALLGACLAVERFADTSASPPRMFVTGELRATAFGSPMPNLPGFDRAAFDFDYGKQVEAATAAALAELAG